jgi:hypothetical protein
MGESLKITDTDAVKRLCEDSHAIRSDIGVQVGGLLTRALRAHPDGVVLHCESIKHRSISQNSFQWLIFNAIARDSSDYPDAQTVHDILLMKRYGCRDLTIDGVTIQRLPQTKKFSVAQCADWLEWLLAFAADHGVKVGMPPGYQQWLEEIT